MNKIIINVTLVLLAALTSCKQSASSDKDVKKNIAGLWVSQYKNDKNQSMEYLTALFKENGTCLFYPGVLGDTANILPKKGSYTLSNNSLMVNAGDTADGIKCELSIVNPYRLNGSITANSNAVLNGKLSLVKR